MRAEMDESGAVLLTMEPDEFALFEALLNRYPQLPDEFHVLSREEADGADREELVEDERLLRASMAEHKGATRGRLRDWLAASGTKEWVDDAMRVRIAPDVVDPVLMALNDVRVAGWARLGRPDYERLETGFDEPQARSALWTMNVCGLILSVILAALSGGPEADEDATQA